MNKSDLVRIMKERTHASSIKEIDNKVSIFFDTIKKSLSNGQIVEIRGLGRFSLRERKPRSIINPKTHQTMAIQAKRVPFFRAGKIQEIVNQQSQIK